MIDFKHTDTPIDFEIVKAKVIESGLTDMGKTTIRELVRLVNKIEKATSNKFIRMEMGVPGLTPPEVGTNAEIASLQRGVASKYPMIEGLEELKFETSRFAKLFLDIDVAYEHCIPTVGSMQGAIATFLITCRRDVNKDTTLFIDPGFPVQKQQHRVLGLKYETFDVYNYRGEKLRDKLESYCSKGNISTLIYSNPNNPSWICFTDTELRIIADVANKYDIIIMEDLAYFGMDFRSDYSKPGVPPYQPTVAKYTDNFILLISSSKAFSYAGQRIGVVIISNSLFGRSFPDLKRFFVSDKLGYAMIYGSVYSLSAGAAHSAQYALAAMLEAVNDGKYNFVEDVKEYGERAKIMKQLFVNNGFTIVYDKDEDLPLADGFYFTFSYKNMSGSELIERLLYYGICALSLEITGSEHTEGLRACVSQVGFDQMETLAYRLQKFNEHHS